MSRTPSRRRNVKLLVVALTVQRVLQIWTIDADPHAVDVDLLLIDPEVSRTTPLKPPNPILHERILRRTTTHRTVQRQGSWRHRIHRNVLRQTGTGVCGNTSPLHNFESPPTISSPCIRCQSHASDTPILH
jgi:hypothetical protein